MLKKLLVFTILGFLILSCTLDTTEEYEDLIYIENVLPDLPQNNSEEIFESQALQISQWIDNMQLSNGLLTSSEKTDYVSLYDNSLAALAFMAEGEIEKAEGVFDYFNERIDSEFAQNNGGFYQLRNSDGSNGRRTWMGDNAWLLIALNNYHQITGNDKYNELTVLLENWIRSLQDEDGGLWGGFNEDGTQIHKVTEGIIMAFNAVKGYDDFHKGILNYLKQERWNITDRLLVAWPENETHYYAMDLHSLGYLIFENFPEDVLYKADRYKNTRVASFNGEVITGYCFDEDKDVIWLEGTAQMALAFKQANMGNEANEFIGQLQKAQMNNSAQENLPGIPYVTNAGTSYGSSLLWEDAPSTPALSSSIWYLFNMLSFNPLDIGKQKNIPNEDKFWNL
ncbi:hypothetical protein [uncultured Eudoraea sp.]|uniref:hypothetical protein n=1 Tax=uncultured Eudoraea sp. TaxID=1035614 RepID=UPI002626FE9D|nr:hypothetical protein [uncultured Eudoraea sp.]